MSEHQKAVRARITGRVQGVSFRDWTARQAKLLGIAGWVRNDPDGAVTALLAGDVEAVEAMLERLNDGPPAALVEDVEVSDAAPEEAGSGFRVTG